jgi:hypothetical protein
MQRGPCAMAKDDCGRHKLEIARGIGAGTGVERSSHGRCAPNQAQPALAKHACAPSKKRTKGKTQKSEEPHSLGPFSNLLGRVQRKQVDDDRYKFSACCCQTFPVVLRRERLEILLLPLAEKDRVSFAPVLRAASRVSCASALHPRLQHACLFFLGGGRSSRGRVQRRFDSLYQRRSATTCSLPPLSPW